MSESPDEHEVVQNVILTGFMGTGKTTVGRLLASRLGFDFVDTDAMIEARHGSIATIFAEQGEAAFRALEGDVAQELAARDRLVVATGGRMMLDPENVATLGRRGRIFCLAATPDAILGRVLGDDSRIERPLLSVADPRRRIVELLTERAPAYRRFEQVATDGRSPDALAEDIANRVRSEPPTAIEPRERENTVDDGDPCDRHDGIDPSGRRSRAGQ